MIFFLFLPALFWGLSYIAIKVGLRYLTPTELISLRLLLAAPVLYTILKYKKIPIRWHQDKLLYVISGLVIFAHFFIMAHGMETVSALDTSWILTTAPIFIMLLSRIILKESISFYPIAGLAVALFGVMALVSEGDFQHLGWLSSVDDWLVLASCVTWAIYTILARIITRRHNSMAATYIMIMIPTILIVPFVFLHSGFGRIMAMPFDGWVAVVFLGVFCLAISFWLWTEGLARHPAAEVGVYLYLEPLVTTFAAVLFLSERFTFSTLIGAVVIFAGVYISSLNSRVKAAA